jgi:hypothetical protein
MLGRFLEKNKILHNTCTLKTKIQKKNNFSTVMVLRMFFFWNPKCSLFDKNVLFSGTIYDLFLKKEHF